LSDLTSKLDSSGSLQSGYMIPIPVTTPVTPFINEYKNYVAKVMCTLLKNFYNYMTVRAELTLKI